MLAAYVGGVRYRCKGRSRSLRDALEHFQAKWISVRRPKMRPHKEKRAKPDSIKTGFALTYWRLFLLNRFDPRSPQAGEAEVKYLDSDFRVVRAGAFVRCAVTGVAIPLEELKYWSVERQEAYSSPLAVLQRLHPDRVKHIK
jgi:hypothetical protein